jgi:glycosyltransferase involved in cell wall biosynthesis
MHNLTKIKIFRTLLYCTYPVALILLFPFALLQKKNKSHLFFFFDRFVMGGAQRIFLDILNSVNNVHKQVYFTRRSADDTLKQLFYAQPNTKSRDIHFWCDNLFFRLFSVHYLCFYINRHKKAHIFGSNSTFFYDMLPFINKKVCKTELLHNFTYGNSGMEFFGLANYKYLSFRVVYDNLTLQNIKQQYAEYNIENSCLNRLLFIEPGVDINTYKEKDFDEPLKILYAGRGGIQKRVWLISQIAEYFLTNNLPVEFHFAGNMESDLSPFVIEKSTLYGMISDEQKMQGIYHTCHVILLTSAYEGFPMVIKEGMANGCVPVVTALAGNKTHLTDNHNALLIDDVENQVSVVKQGIEKLKILLENKPFHKELSINCRQYAVTHFDKKYFEQQIHDFLINNDNNLYN